MANLKLAGASASLLLGFLLSVAIPASMRSDIGVSEYVKIIIGVLVATVLNLIVTIVTVKKRPAELNLYVASIVLSIFLNAALAAAVTLIEGDPEGVMWLPVALIFLPMYLFPSMLGVSVGVYLYFGSRNQR